MIKLEDVEWLGYEEAVTDAGRELHCWRLLKVNPPPPGPTVQVLFRGMDTVEQAEAGH